MVFEKRFAIVRVWFISHKFRTTYVSSPYSSSSALYPTGTTIAGIHELEKGGFRNLLMNAVTAAARRGKEMANEWLPCCHGLESIASSPTIFDAQQFKFSQTHVGLNDTKRGYWIVWRKHVVDGWMARAHSNEAMASHASVPCTRVRIESENPWLSSHTRTFR